MVRLGAALCGLAILAGMEGVTAQTSSAQGTTVQGLWRNDNNTTIRVTVKKSEATGTFVDIAEGARTLGFKPGEVSFVGTMSGNYLHGEQTLRYGGTCHPNGRKIPFIGRLTPDGKVLAIHFYNIDVDANCRDTGQYSVTETLWQKVGAK